MPAVSNDFGRGPEETPNSCEKKAGAQTSAKGTFSGPLFIVGRPRSGTKLLMTLLNEHPRVSIPIAETNFMSSMVARFGDPPRFDDPARLDDFYRRFSNTVFFEWRKSFDVVLTKDELRVRADLNLWSSIFETILKYHAPKPVVEGVIWGDKSPVNLTWIGELKSMFETARVLHIIRDPRDLSLSAKKAWGKHPYGSADSWQREVSAARAVGSRLGTDYLEIKYEALLNDSAKTMRLACSFLEVEFTPEMLQLSVSYEELGDATGRLDVVTSNQNKYTKAFDARKIRRIEEIVYPTLLESGYTADFADTHLPLEPISRRALSVRDGVALTWHYSKVNGVSWGLKYLLRQVQGRMAGPGRGRS